MIASRKISLVLAEYAPLALLAARSLGVRTLTTGQGFGLPPWHLSEFPLLSPEHTTRLHDEAILLENVNKVAASHGMAPLGGLPEVYRADTTLIRSVPFLDPYTGKRRDRYVPPVTNISTNLASAGTEVFVYFSTRELGDPAVVDALARLPLPRRGYLPNATPQVAAQLAASGMIVESAPVSATDITRRSRLTLNAGQHGTLSLGLFAGVPQVCLPQQAEQRWNANAAAGQGVARVIRHDERSSDAIIAAICEAYDDDAMFARAGDPARQLRAEMGGDPDAILAHALRPVAEALLA